jgi:hypothetical protein
MKKTKTSAAAAPRSTTTKPAAAEAPASKPVVAAKAVAASKPVETAKPVAAPKPAEAPKAVAAPKSVEVTKPVEASKPVAAVKRAKSAGPQPTVIQANVDVGFGNSLYVRGEGPGLSWERGVAMDCVRNDLWAHTIEAAAKPIIFKFLVNDETWCTGDDYVVEPGNKITLVPTI